MEHGHDQRGKRKPIRKQLARRGRGRGSGSSAAPRESIDRETHRQYMHQEDVQQQIGYTISREGDQGTHFHLAEANIGYMVLRTEEFNLTAPKNAANHRYESYYRKFKEVADAREINTYTNPKSLVVDYRFWDGFHSNFYASVIFDSKKGKICKMHYIDWVAMRDKNEPEFNAAINTCERYDLTNIMGFRYNWNVEILAQFHSTYFWNRDSDEIHWMTDGRHYRISFINFCQILGFGEQHRTYSRIHQDNPFRVSDISHCWRVPSRQMARGVV
jgi:hypothetical protein